MIIGNKKVLIVEDEFSIALDIKISLEKLGYVIVGIANNYDEAIGFVEDAMPDVVIMDINISGEKNEISVMGLFIAIGHKPNTNLFKGVLDMDETGYLITEGKTTKTNLPGVFAAGRVL